MWFIVRQLWSKRRDDDDDDDHSSFLKNLVGIIVNSTFDTTLDNNFPCYKNKSGFHVSNDRITSMRVVIWHNSLFAAVVCYFWLVCIDPFRCDPSLTSPPKTNESEIILYSRQGMRRWTINNKRRGKFTRELAEAAMVNFAKDSLEGARAKLCPRRACYILPALLFVSQ